MDNWSQNRWTWKRCVRRDPRLSTTAKLVAVSLCDDFAHHETAYCNPGVETIAEALCLCDRSILRAIAQLRDAGWISVMERRGRGRRSEYSFNKGDGTVAFSDVKKVTSLSNCSDEKVTVLTGKGDKSVTPYKDEPTNNQKAREGGDRPSPQCRVCVHPHSDQELEWDGWLSHHGFPRLSALGIRSSDERGAGWDAPFRFPPGDPESIEGRIALKWADWASSRMIERRSA